MGPYPGPSPNEEETTGEVSPYMIKKIIVYYKV